VSGHVAQVTICWRLARIRDRKAHSEGLSAAGALASRAVW